MKDDRVYLGHILRCIARIEEYTVNGRDTFFASHLVQDGVVRNLQTLAESSRRLSQDVKALHPGVDWKGLAGFRNVLVHDCGQRQVSTFYTPTLGVLTPKSVSD